MNMVSMVGDRLKSILTGRLYQVRMLTEFFAVLEGEDPSHRVYTEIGNLASLYEQVEIGDDQGDSFLSPGLRSPSDEGSLRVVRRESSTDTGIPPIERKDLYGD
jgi:hypothetical protein